MFSSLLSTDSGLPGKGNDNRSLWSLNQGVAFGMKGVLWFIGLRQMNKATGEWTEAGRDINRVNAQIMPLKGELLRLGKPVAGQFTMGVFVDDEDRDAVYVANLNAYASQTVALKLGRVATPRLFDRRTAGWRELPVADGTMSLELGPGEGELVRVE